MNHPVGAKDVGRLDLLVTCNAGGDHRVSSQFGLPTADTNRVTLATTTGVAWSGVGMFTVDVSRIRQHDQT